MQHERSIKFIIESKIDCIVLLSEAVKATCLTVTQDNDVLHKIMLSLVEAVTNVINHAYLCNPENFIEVVVNLSHERITLEIIDTGMKSALPIQKKELHYNPNDMTTWPESGMGFFLIQHIMDEMSFSYKDGKNILTMKKQLK